MQTKGPKHIPRKGHLSCISEGHHAGEEDNIHSVPAMCQLPSSVDGEPKLREDSSWSNTGAARAFP
jgi:hypothetical protein